VILYEMVAGTVPFNGETSTDVIAAIVKTDPTPITLAAPETPAKLEEIVSKALEKDCEERYQTIKDLLVDLRRLKKKLDFESETERSLTPDRESLSKAPSTISHAEFVPTVHCLPSSRTTSPLAIRRNPTTVALRRCSSTNDCVSRGLKLIAAPCFTAALIGRRSAQLRTSCRV